MSSGITRKKGQSGKARVVQCIQCGQLVPRDKAIRKRKSSLRLDYKLRALLKKRGAYISNRSSMYIIVCLVANTENMSETTKKRIDYIKKLIEIKREGNEWKKEQ